MSRFQSSAAELIAAMVVAIVMAVTAHAAPPPPDLKPGAVSEIMAERDLFLEVFINDVSTRVIAAFKEAPEGGLTAAADDLATAGLKPVAAALTADGRVRLDRLPGVTYRVDEATQQLRVTTSDAARVTRTIDARNKPQGEMLAPRANYGAVLNYALFAATGALKDLDFGRLDTFSGTFDARLFGPYGTLSQSFIAGRSGDWLDDVTRLNTTWSYSDPYRMMTYCVGDLVSGGLSWTRPVYLGGAQVQRNFGLRSDLVTTPLPSFAGSAAVPSTLEVYTHNVRTWSGAVAAGPFELVNMPVIGGAGEARVVLKDSQGRETVTTLPFYTSDKLLQAGLFYFSAEAGLPRTGIGVESADYDDSPFAILSARYGLTNRLTLEGHIEVGQNLISGGAGAAFALGTFGTASFAAAGSAHGDRLGMLANAALELRTRGWSLFGRVQRTFGDYDDVASVSARPAWHERHGEIAWDDGTWGAGVPRGIDQLTLSIPTPFERANLQLSYARLDSDFWADSKILSLSYVHQIRPRTTFRASLFQDLDGGRDIGFFAGLTFPLGGDVTGAIGYDHRADGAYLVGEAVKPERPEVGSVGWRLRASEGEDTIRSAGASYRASFGRFETTVHQYRNEVRGTAQMEGAVAFAGGGVFPTRRLYDAFAVVNVGAPDVEVKYQNRVVGTTDGSGSILVPNLNAYERNAISIDPSNLPVDAQIPSTKEIVVPADRSGVVVDFGVSAEQNAALIAFVGADGAPLRAGLAGRIEGASEAFIVGYGGEAFVQGLAPVNVVVIEDAAGKVCRAEFAYQANRGSQIRIEGVICR